MKSIGKGRRIDWLDFKFNKNKDTLYDEELEGLDFLEENIKSKWKNFWPQTGKQQNWDAVGWLYNSNTPDLLLVEAKAHLEEINSNCCAKPASVNGGRNKIEEAFDEVKKDIGIPPNSDWLNGYYQCANRIATLWFLNKHNISTRLVFIYFIGDNIKSTCPNSEQEWAGILNEQDNHLGIGQSHYLKNRIHKVFLPVGDK